MSLYELRERWIAERKRRARSLHLLFWGALILAAGGTIALFFVLMWIL